MRPTFAFATFAAWMTAALLLTAAPARAAGNEMKVEAQLIWATNDQADPNPKHKPVAGDVKAKLEQLPLRWVNYFEVNKNSADIPAGQSKRVKLSDKCEVEIKNLDDKKIEVALIGGKGDPVLKRIQSLPKGDILVLGGNAPNATAWLVALKRVK